MGYGYNRYIKAITNGVEITQAGGTALIQFTLSGNDLTTRPQGATTGDHTIYCNGTDNFPRLNLKGNEELDLVMKSAKSLRIYSEGTQAYDISYNANVSTITGGSVSGDHLKLLGDSTNSYPYVLIRGNDNLDMQFGAGQQLRVGENGTLFFGIAESTDAQLITFSNKNLALVPNGTGVVKFGTHNAITTETNSGYITIKDSGGTDRKLCVVS